MSKASRFALDWSDRDVASFLSAIAKAKDVETGSDTGKRPSAGRRASARQSVKVKEIIYAERLWLRLNRDPNFTELVSKADLPIGCAAWIRLLEAVVMGVVVGREPLEHPDSKTRERALRHAKTSER